MLAPELPGPRRGGRRVGHDRRQGDPGRRSRRRGRGRGPAQGTAGATCTRPAGRRTVASGARSTARRRARSRARYAVAMDEKDADGAVATRCRATSARSPVADDAPCRSPRPTAAAPRRSSCVAGRPRLVRLQRSVGRERDATTLVIARGVPRARRRAASRPLTLGGGSTDVARRSAARASSAAGAARPSPFRIGARLYDAGAHDGSGGRGRGAARCPSGRCGRDRRRLGPDLPRAIVGTLARRGGRARRRPASAATGLRVLEVGCGAGAQLWYLGPRGAPSRRARLRAGCARSGPRAARR